MAGVKVKFKRAYKGWKAGETGVLTTVEYARMIDAQKEHAPVVKVEDIGGPVPSREVFEKQKAENAAKAEEAKAAAPKKKTKKKTKTREGDVPETREG